MRRRVTTKTATGRFNESDLMHVDVQVEGEYPDFADSYLLAACWVDNGEPLTEAELEMVPPETVHVLVLNSFF